MEQIFNFSDIQSPLRSEKSKGQILSDDSSATFLGKITHHALYYQNTLRFLSLCYLSFIWEYICLSLVNLNSLEDKDPRYRYHFVPAKPPNAECRLLNLIAADCHSLFSTDLVLPSLPQWRLNCARAWSTFSDLVILFTINQR